MSDEIRDVPRMPAKPLPPGHDEKPSIEPGSGKAGGTSSEATEKLDDQLEEELEDTFPASDPPSITQPK